MPKSPRIAPQTQARIMLGLTIASSVAGMLGVVWVIGRDLTASRDRRADQASQVATENARQAAGEGQIPSRGL